MSRLRVTLVGAGRAGALHAANLADYAARAEVVAVVDERREAAETLGPAVGLDEALERCDAVVISTPTFTHRDLVVRTAGPESTSSARSRWRSPWPSATR